MLTIFNFFRYMLTQPDRFDVALLHLDRPVFYQDNIIPICLPPPDIYLTGKIGLVAGWGKTDNSFGKTGTNILHKVLVPIIKNDECIRWHEDKNILVQVQQPELIQLFPDSSNSFEGHFKLIFFSFTMRCSARGIRKVKWTHVWEIVVVLSLYITTAGQSKYFLEIFFNN